MTIFPDFNLISSSWQNPRWQPLLVTSQAFSSSTIHKIYLVLLRKSKAKSFRNTATYQKLWGGIPSTPSPRYHGGDMNLLVRPRVILGMNKGCFAVSPWLKHVLQSRRTDHECICFLSHSSSLVQQEVKRINHLSDLFVKDSMTKKCNNSIFLKKKNSNTGKFRLLTLRVIVFALFSKHRNFF